MSGSAAVSDEDMVVIRNRWISRNRKKRSKVVLSIDVLKGRP